ncbi:MAG: Crp/Fnr family transcriptional regulator [Azoarcus sp.]|jgi:CRP-like cAMP-binding protein|nr:Crp/Fnr family transcriptional regulator [Azoarcus sp.]
MLLPLERSGTKKPKPDYKALLAGQPLFSSLSSEEIARITQNVREIRPQKGEILFNKGDECRGLHILLSGLVKLFCISPRGQEKVVEIIHPGHMFGEALMFLGRPYIVSSQALADSWVLYFPKSTIFEELERRPELARKMLASLSMRLHQLISDIENYSLHSGKKRVIGYLLREISDESLPTEDHACTIRFSISKNVIASHLNMTQEHFSRILHELADLGLISVHGREIHVPDIRRLQQYED